MTFPVFASGDVLNASDMNAVGLWKITPTSVAGTGVTLSGNVVNFSASTSISVNGVFSSTYENYKIIITGSATGNADNSIRLRAAGTDTTTNYQFTAQGYYASARNDNANNTATQWEFFCSMGSSRGSGSQIELFRPNTTDAWKSATANSAFAHSAVGVITRNCAGVLNSATQFDGFTVIVGGGFNATGQLRVYGYRN